MNMRYRRLGTSGLQVSELSLGSWLTFGKLITDDTAEALMKLAYDNGVNFFDNAEILFQGRKRARDGSHPPKDGMAARYLDRQ